MGKDHRGQPSGTNKKEGLGLRPDMPPEKLEQDEEMTNKYTTGEDELAEHVRMRHPNRNTDKDDATTAGGYKQ
jgi:hypothetical protein